MKFFLDANLPRSLKEVFAQCGEVHHVNDNGRGHGMTDKEIAQMAVNAGAILVTRDLEFANPTLFPEGSHVGLLILRLPSFYGTSQMMSLLRTFLSKTPLPDLEGGVTILEPGRVRTLRRKRRESG